MSRIALLLPIILATGCESLPRSGGRSPRSLMVAAQRALEARDYSTFALLVAPVRCMDPYFGRDATMRDLANSVLIREWPLTYCSDFSISGEAVDCLLRNHMQDLIVPNLELVQQFAQGEALRLACGDPANFLYFYKESDRCTIKLILIRIDGDWSFLWWCGLNALTL